METQQLGSTEASSSTQLRSGWVPFSLAGVSHPTDESPGGDSHDGDGKLGADLILSAGFP